MANDKETLQGRIDMAIDELKDYALEEPREFAHDPGDRIHEIADGCVPVYHSDLLEIAADDNDMATNEPELGPAFDGKATPVNIIAANIFEAIEAALWDYWNEHKGDLVEDDDSLNDTKEAS